MKDKRKNVEMEAIQNENGEEKFVPKKSFFDKMQEKKVEFAENHPRLVMAGKVIGSGLLFGAGMLVGVKLSGPDDDDEPEALEAATETELIDDPEDDEPTEEA